MKKSHFVIIFIAGLTGGLTATSFGQTVTNLAISPSNNASLSQHMMADQNVEPDTSINAVPADSTINLLQNGWLKQPGQMPLFVQGNYNAMPLITPPPVDQKMIIPSHGVPTVSTDSLQTTNDESTE